MNDRNKITLPEWTRNLPNATKITSKEILSFFGYKSTRSMSTLIERGQLPKHNFSCFTANRAIRHFWSLGTLRSFEIEQNKANKQ